MMVMMMMMIVMMVMLMMIMTCTWYMTDCLYRVGGSVNDGHHGADDAEEDGAADGCDGGDVELVDKEVPEEVGDDDDYDDNDDDDDDDNDENDDYDDGGDDGLCDERYLSTAIPRPTSYSGVI